MVSFSKQLNFYKLPQQLFVCRIGPCTYARCKNTEGKKRTSSTYKYGSGNSPCLSGEVRLPFQTYIRSETEALETLGCDPSVSSVFRISRTLLLCSLWPRPTWSAVTTLRPDTGCRSDESPFRPKSLRANSKPGYMDKISSHKKTSSKNVSDNYGQNSFD
jgi:hypothetical protein